MKKLRERDIEKAVCDYARRKGFLAYKFVSPQRRSVPDRLFISPNGECFFIEFKAPGKTVTDAQAREILRIQGNHRQVWIVSDIFHGQDIIDLYE